MSGEDSAVSGVWVGEWIGRGKLVVFDPAAQSDENVVTFFDVAGRCPSRILSHRVAHVIRRVDGIGGSAAALETYAEWKEKAARHAESAPRKAKGGVRVARATPGFSDAPVIPIDDAVLDADWKDFIALFPAGFEDPLFLSQEREYKLEGQQRVRTLLDADAAGLPADELAQRFQKAGAATDNLLFSTEHAALHGALKLPGEHGQRLVDAYHALLAAESDGMEAAFTAWADAIEALPKTGKTTAFKWPVATALPYLAQPEVHCILKPENAKATAKRYRLNLRYTSHPNFTTYRRWLDIVEALGARLRERGARDTFDVQSFIWRVGEAQR